MRVEGSDLQVTEGFTGLHVWLNQGACLQRSDEMAPVYNSNLELNSCPFPKSSNLTLRGVHMEKYKGTGSKDIYPCLRAEFGVNKLSGSSRDTFHTEPVSSRLADANGCLDIGCLDVGCLDAGCWMLGCWMPR